MLKEFLKEKNISLYAVSKGSGVPYTTLNELVNEKKSLNNCSIKTIYALATYFGMSIDVFLRKINKDSIKPVVNQSWEEKRKHIYFFPVIEPSKQYDARRIHPLKQRVIKKLYSSLIKDHRIDSIILFGSSTTIRCNKMSDVDLYIELKPDYQNSEVKNDVSSVVQEILNWRADIIWADRIKKNSSLDKNIEMGVKII